MILLSALMLALLLCSCESVEKNQDALKSFGHDVLDEEIDDIKKEVESLRITKKKRNS